MDSEVGVLQAKLDKSALKGVKPKQRIQSHSFQELSLGLAVELSYRKASEMMNRFLHRSGDAAVRSTTLEDRVEAFGCALSAAYEDKAGEILESNQIDRQSGVVGENSVIPSAVRAPDLPAALGQKQARRLMADYNRGKESRMKIRYGEQVANTEASPERCCYISVDDVGVKSQKERRKGGAKRSKKYVENTVIHIHSDGKQYAITAVGMDKAFKLLMAFLLENRLMENRRLIFFTDGAANIRDRIKRMFAFREHTIILDWLHLEKKCMEYMSMAVKGTKTEKETLKRTLVSILWTGRADRALEYLGSIKEENIKSHKILGDLEGYLGRKAPDMACYALRHELGLRISSNRVEKENDLVVASRQKHNGMAWSEKGSAALAIITAARRNGELHSFVIKRQIGFKLVG